MTIVAWNTLEREERKRLLARPAMETTEDLRSSVAAIIDAVRRGGDAAVVDYGKRFDGRAPESLLATPDELAMAQDELDPAIVRAIDTAIGTVTRFHEAARPQDLMVETAKGVTCEARWRALDPVGLYVPAGTAPLPSTAVMLGVPARLAGCRNIVLATPPGADGRADAAVRHIAHRLEIDTVLVAGGAQAVAAMAYGTESVPKVVRVFGPGNRFVTEAKRQAAQDPAGAAMDLPAGPSEVMVIADESAEADFVAMDLLSQAEHGPDSQVFLVTDSDALARDVFSSLERLTAELPRAETAGRALEHGAIIVVDRLDEAVGVANDYAPEHLIIATDNARELCNDITSAGSVFLGHYTPEALGDYISGTNHVLPTGGWARSYAGLALTDFMRRMTVQEATPEGLRTLGPDGARLAAHEGLDAHRLAIQMRLDRIGESPK
ncbi:MULTISPECIES: histidinol dehydrogenase [unclassified Wenzhouxiangella]|uniref:histidinol dehydrogenase n=1 Tax=unclassified Wenzhouxiangella TaxID=2613841 RepID=UPI000E32C056|nr:MULTISPECIES: histidinol dehydrogenase [unclassified Wenzhouxiangella]RFF27411.1 histidinol dehydrogenase [Wenzhouxiangella sp. 15181]RFP68839.1 histidinol dehydrogenase [Wenzhouxiangella sp. 15190]